MSEASNGLLALHGEHAIHGLKAARHFAAWGMANEGDALHGSVCHAALVGLPDVFIAGCEAANLPGEVMEEDALDRDDKHAVADDVRAVLRHPRLFAHIPKIGGRGLHGCGLGDLGHVGELFVLGEGQEVALNDEVLLRGDKAGSVLKLSCQKFKHRRSPRNRRLFRPWLRPSGERQSWHSSCYQPPVLRATGFHGVS